MSRSDGLAFQKTECQACGGDRTFGSSCPECGRAGRANEVNSTVVRRQSGLRQISQLVRDVDSATMTSAVFPLDNVISPLLNELVKGIRLFASTDGSPASVERLADLLLRVNSLRFQVARTPMLRPSLALTRATRSTLDRFYELWLAWEKVLGAPTIEEVQRLQSVGLSLLNSTGATLIEYSATANAVAVYEDYAEPNLLKRTLSALQLAHPELSFGEFAAEGSRMATEQLGLPVRPSMGAQYLALLGIAEVHFDPERFKSVLKESANFCFENPKLVEVSLCPGALPGLSAAQRSMVESLKALEAIVQIEGNEHSIFRRIFSFYGEVYEDVAAPIFAWYCRLADLKSMPYEKLIGLNATDLAAKLESSETTAGWFEGTDAYLRNADGHGRKTYSIDGDLVTFHLKSFRGTLSIAEVLDKFYSLFESLAAVSWALSNALEQAGIDIPVTENDVEYLGISAFDISCVWLEQHGETLVEARTVDGSWELQLGPGNSVVSDIALRLAQVQSGEFRQMRIHRLSTEDPLLTVPLDRYTRAKALEDTGAEDLERVLAELELKMASQLGGTSVVTREDIEFAIGIFGLHLVSPNGEFIRHMRVARTAATRAPYPDLVALADRVFSAFRKPNLKAAPRLGGELRQLIHKSPSVFPESNNVLIQSLVDTPDP